jgi:hypothetical protein
MRTHRIALILAIFLAIVAAPTVGFACDNDGNCTCGDANKTAADAPGCCAGKSAAMLASAAENGCEASMKGVVAWAKKSENEEAIALAAKAEGGCEHSKSALIAMARESEESAQPAQQTTTMAQLAEWAESGCAKSAASLIAAAKESDDQKAVELASRAEGGCEHSKAALIALAKESEESTDSDGN